MDNQFVIKDGQNYMVTTHADYPSEGYAYFTPHNATSWPSEEAALAVVKDCPLRGIHPSCKILSVGSIEGAAFVDGMWNIPRKTPVEKEHAVTENQQTIEEQVATLQKQVKQLMAEVQPHRGTWST